MWVRLAGLHGSTVARPEYILAEVLSNGTLRWKDQVPELFDSNTRILKSHIPVIGIICCVLYIGPCMHMGIHTRVGSVVLLD